MTRPLITSTSNDRLKHLRRLSRRRRGMPTFLAEGGRAVRAAFDAGADVCELYAAPELFISARDHALVELAESVGARVYELGADAFRSVVTAPRPDGLAAVVERWDTSLDRIDGADLVLVAHGIERPGNLGTIVRTAAAAGAAALLATDLATDVFHPDTVRGSVGTLFHVPLAEAQAIRATEWLRDRGVRIVVATPTAATAYWECDLGEPCAIVVGGERTGVGSEWLVAADDAVSIPMAGAADSLNVAVAAGVVVFEAVRQRERYARST